MRAGLFVNRKELKEQSVRCELVGVGDSGGQPCLVSRTVQLVDFLNSAPAVLKF